MKIVFMGTPDFAVGALQAVIDAGYEVAAVVTQPDKPKGRGKQVQMTPVKTCALQHNIPVFQPKRIKDSEAVEALRGFEADLFVVAAFGQILSREILDIPRLGCVNIHASLLPKYRGAAPIQWAILNGEKETGITLMQMDEGMDTGAMLAKCILPISETETGESLFEKLAQAGAKLLIEKLPDIEAGRLEPQPQNSEEATYAPMIRKEMGKIDWNRTAVELERKIRGLNSWPSAYTYLNQKGLKIWEAKADEGSVKDTPGTVTEVTADSIRVQTGEGSLILKSIQLEGKKRMDVKSFLLGYSIVKGQKLGEEEL